MIQRSAGAAAAAGEAALTGAVSRRWPILASLAQQISRRQQQRQVTQSVGSAHAAAAVSVSPSAPPPHQSQPASVSEAPSSPADSRLPQQALKFLNVLTVWYEALIGLDKVRGAQQAVLAAEEQFLDSQQARRSIQQQQQSLTMERDRLELEMDRYQKGDDKYLQLILREHDLIKSEQSLAHKLQSAEYTERKKFAQLSATFRASHEQERAHSQRTKYWTLIASLGGTLLGVLAAFLHRLMMLREAEHNQRLAGSLQAQSDRLDALTTALASAASPSAPSAQPAPETKENVEELQRLLDANAKRSAYVAGGAVLSAWALTAVMSKLWS